MLSQQTIGIVKSTAPILQEHGETLTKHFYNRMFSQNPEVAPYFNFSNQAQGTQQRALAGAICAYAANIDNLEALGSAVELIAQKHASLMIKPEHYPIVGENLIASIREVLGENATNDIIKAWEEAYSLLADIMIGREKQIYIEGAMKPGGWEGFRNFIVEKKIVESNIITSFYIKPEDGGPLPNYLPGQYITLRMSTPDGSTTMRNYSLSDKPKLDYFRISVKKEVHQLQNTPDGFVSNKLHNDIEIGDVLEVGPPRGEFFLDINEKHERPLVLLAAGIGITPILSILKSTIDSMPEREIIFIHCCLNKEAQPFKSIIDEMHKRHRKLTVHYRYSALEAEEVLQEDNCSVGFLDAELIESLVSDRNADYYFCGPKAFMVSIYQDLLKWGVPGNQFHFEFFGPKEELEKAI